MSGQHTDDPDAVTLVTGLIGLVEPFDGKPRAQKVLVTGSAHVVVFAFGAGDELHDHAAHHPVLIQALSGHVRLAYDDTVLDLRPGDLVHLPPMKRHAVTAVVESTLTVTMLVAG